jgi:alkylation response protein AidB-like acyl-CoA dehydrogenase
MSSTTAERRSLVTDHFGEWAAEIDRGDRDVRSGLRVLGEHGLLDLGAGQESRSALPDMVELIRDVAAECLSSAFSLWAHRMVIEYVARGRRTAATDDLAASLAGGEVIGSTAMAPALRDVAGIEPVPIVATRTATGLRLRGKISWASNLFPDALVAVPVRFEAGGRAVVLIRTTDPGVRVHPAPELLALNATASSSVALDEVEVPGDAVLTEDLGGFVTAFRPTFLLLQTAFCSGLADRSLAEARPRTTGFNEELAAQADDLSAEAESVRRRLFGFASGSAGEPTVADLLRLRLDGAQAAVRATRLEATVRGGAGYLAAGATSRRLREAAFLPIQAPTEGELRWALSRAG